ncbi:MAG: hypothetical protein HYU41_12090 [Candidatus Rokubacteria bacterium]|nr:hypothetical protein [Candidatus Rokubacteria bacterium]
MLLSLLVYGCATYPVTVEIEPPPAERKVEPHGHISTRPGRTGVVVAAPHGTCDPRTGDIASEIARRTGFGLVVATGFTLETGSDGRPLLRYHVNRPTEGKPGHGPSEDRATPGARRVYEAYERHVQQASAGPLRFYVEIHGNGRTENATRIEIATVGVDHAHAAQLRALFELTRDAHLRGNREAPRLDVRVEPADPLFYAASGTKRDGILRRPERALHIELPRAARRDFREIYTVILAEFLAEALALRPLK